MSNSGNEPRNGVTCVACADCETLYEPKRDQCPECGATELK